MQEEISQKRPREEETNKLSQASQDHADRAAKKVKETRDSSTQTSQQTYKLIPIKQITELCKMKPKSFIQEVKKIGNHPGLKKLYLYVYETCSNIEKAYLSTKYWEGSKAINNLQKSTMPPISKEIMVNVIKDKASQLLTEELHKMVTCGDYTWNKRCNSVTEIIEECVKLDMPQYLEKMHLILKKYTSHTRPSKMRDGFLAEQNKLEETILKLKSSHSQEQTSEISSASSSDIMELEINDAAHGLLALGGATSDSYSDNVN